MSTCPNCGESAPGAYCPACGQRQFTGPLTLRYYLGEVFEELFTLDGKLPATLRDLLFRPGSLSVAWSRGRRTAFVSPLRVYLLAAGLFFLVSEFVPRGTSVSLEGQIRVYLLTVSVPVLALLLRLVFDLRRPVPSLVPYVVFALHAHAFVLIVLSAAYFPLIFAAPTHSPISLGIVGVFAVLLVGYFTASLHTWRALAWWRALGATILLGVLWYAVAVGFAMAVLVVLGDGTVTIGAS